jgi:hypothetical protein
VRPHAKRRLGLVLGLISAAILASALRAADGADARPRPLLGRWHSVENSEAGVASVFEFHASGVFDYSPANVVEMPYRVEGDALFLPSETKGGPEHKQTIDWVGEDRIRLSAPGTLSLFLDRKAGSGPKKSIVGEWTGPRDVGGRSVQAVYQFRTDGRLLLVMALLTAQGRFTLDGDKIQMAVPEKWSAYGTYRVDGDVLTLSIVGQKGTKDSKYARY